MALDLKIETEEERVFWERVADVAICKDLASVALPLVRALNEYKERRKEEEETQNESN